MVEADVASRFESLGTYWESHARLRRTFVAADDGEVRFALVEGAGPVDVATMRNGEIARVCGHSSTAHVPLLRSQGDIGRLEICKPLAERRRGVEASRTGRR